MSVRSVILKVKELVRMNKASERQVGFIETLLTERVWEEAVELASLSSKEASDLISGLLKAPKSAGIVSKHGIYQVENGDIYRVQPSQNTGRFYAKKLVFTGGWEYEAGAIYRLKDSQRMTLEEAKAFGMATGLCCVCGRFLNDPKSVEQGIGPVCIKKVW
jgi:hypothetical protein